MKLLYAFEGFCSLLSIRVASTRLGLAYDRLQVRTSMNVLGSVFLKVPVKTWELWRLGLSSRGSDIYRLTMKKNC